MYLVNASLKQEETRVVPALSTGSFALVSVDTH